MYFKRLEMHGFKSFAEPVIMDFHEGITCIVGPNGSGKSNVSDALRWVLGEQSPKALRGGKMEEVIFNGTESRKPRGMAEVTLVIDNSAGFLDIEYEEVAITRRMFRSGESEYRINNNPCRLKDIRELIMDTGIGVDGYSIIGQGKISDIVSNKTESRREIFEEAAGIVAYKTRKAEAERKLTGTKNNLERIDDIIGEIEGRIGGLEADSKKAQRYLTLRDRYQELEINITLRNVENLQKRIQQYQDDIHALSDEITALVNQKTESEAMQSELRKRSEILDGLNQEAHQKQLSLVETINALQSAKALNKEKLAALDRDEERLTKEHQELTERLESAKAEVEQLTQDRLKTRIAANDAEKVLAEKIALFQQVSQESTKFTTLLDDSNEKIISLSGTASSKRSEANSYENFKVTLQDRRENIQRRNQDLAALIESGRNELDAMEKEYEVLHQSGNQYREAKERRQKRFQELSQKEHSLRQTMEEQRIDFSSREARWRTIQELEQNHDGYNNAVKYIMRMGLKGVDGVVGEMMSVPEGYETAIETALGGAMQNVITQNDASAKKAITVLKVNRSGRLTFLPVSSIRGQRVEPDRRVMEHPGYRGMASDLVSYDAKYDNVFQYLLGRVVIVDTLDSAIAMSKMMRKGVRFVTLDGEVINASGAITGGQYKNKSAGLLQRRNEVEQLKKQMDATAEALKETKVAYQDTREELQQLQKEMEEARAANQDFELKQVTLREQMISLSNDLEDKEEDIEKNNEEITAIGKELASVESMIAEMVKASKEAESEISKITSEMDKISQEHQETKEAATNASDAITEARIEAERWKEKIEHIEGLLERVADTIEDLQFQVEDREEELANIAEQRQSVSGGAMEEDEKVSALEKEKEDVDGRIVEIQKEKETLQQKQNSLEEALSGADEKLSQKRDQKYQLEIKGAKAETQLDTLKSKLWDEFEVTFAEAMDRRQENFQMTAATKESREIRNQLREIGDVNVGAIAEFQQVSQRYEFLTTQRDDVVKAMNELETIINDLDKTINWTFRENFNQVEVHFEQVFQELFGGGHAELRLEDEAHPLESGIDIIAQPPGKRLQNINLLSGGEKTMTAIALMFAVLRTKPTPFCILDEVEAALDDENIYKFSRYLKHFASTQFALITHQKATMETADVLYGITMPEQGVSKMLSLRMGDYDPKEFTS